MCAASAPRDAEVRQHVRRGQHQDVLRLHVPVQDALPVRERQRVRDRDPGRDDLAHRERPVLLEPVVRRPEVVVLHHDARLPGDHAGVER
ncbi:hypothetical protein Q5530_00940 [Saccharothrix sp. BKS2]